MASGSYWCYSCNRFVWVSSSISCPDCCGGFLKHIHRRSPTRFPLSSTHAPLTCSSTNRSPNHVIVLRGSDASEAYDRSAFHMYYDDGSDSGLRPLRSFCWAPDSIGCWIRSLAAPLHVIEIDRIHLESDSQSHCAVCKESFELKSSAKEMP
ncbi:unnamed protein product, partial [Brassica rapa subsp. narinosa]